MSAIVKERSDGLAIISDGIFLGYCKCGIPSAGRDNRSVDPTQTENYFGADGFGAGALLFALTTELFGHALHVASDEHGTIVNAWIVIMTMTGAVVGGLLFELLNQILNNKGAFLRKGALIKKHVAREKRHQARVLFRGLSRVKVLQHLPAEEIIKLIPYLKTAEFKQGQIIFKEG